MVNFIVKYYQLLLLLGIWTIAGVYDPLLGYLLIIAGIVILISKNLFTELLMGFIFILIMDDNIYNHIFMFTPVAKMFYILALSFFFTVSTRVFFPVFRIFLWFAPFFALALVTLFLNSPVMDEGFQKTISYLLVVIVVPNYLLQAYRKSGPEVFKDLFYFGILVIIAGFVVMIFGKEYVMIKGRYAGIFGNPNGLGIFCTLLFLLYSLSEEFYPSLYSRADKFLFFGFIILSLVLAASRTAYLALGIFFLFRLFHGISPFLSFTMLIAVLVGYELIFFNIVEIIRFFKLEAYFRLHTLTEASGRIIAWNYSMDEINRNFFMGRGFHYDVFYFRQHYSILQKMGHEGLVHNSFLSIWLNTGIIGLLSFLAPLLYLIFRTSTVSVLAIPILYTVLTSSFLESWLAASLNPFSVFFWIILTMLNSHEIYGQKETDTISVH
ncbi:MAG: O-antigen ligase family protein [Bacteroidetes bacterium]|nr:O-antigen ligase family protein [Bacteroidota bacterium]